MGEYAKDADTDTTYCKHSEEKVTGSSPQLVGSVRVHEPSVRTNVWGHKRQLLDIKQDEE